MGLSAVRFRPIGLALWSKPRLPPDEPTLGVADRGYVLENGHVVMSDTGANLLANSDVRKAYLGHG